MEPGSASWRNWPNPPSERGSLIEIIPLTGIGEVVEGANLAALIGEALDATGITLRSTDILVITQKIVSKAEGRFRNLADVTPGEEAERLARIVDKDPRLVELALCESTAVVRSARDVLITRHRLGLVMANAGIDRSNVGPGGEDRVLLLPLDPDASAQRIAEQLAAHGRTVPAVVISDSFGRPWRYGVTGAGIGASGLPSLIDRRGDLDRDGRKLEVTQIALADIVATAALLATGEGAEGVPAVLMRGLSWEGDASPASTLVRALDEDLFQ
jgi:coenzyme F420-0:L-glutamate ligase / coenzyme F420-1:gamma-L-glutamate ligase